MDQINSSQIQNEIIGLEKKYWKAMVDKDIESAISLTHFPCTVAGPHGAERISEDQYRQILQTSNTDQYRNVDINDARVDVWNDQTAMITYSTLINGHDFLDVSTWIREDGKWVCSYHSENPFVET